MLHMLKVFQRHIVSVCSKYFIYFHFPDVCCNLFLSRYCICSTHMFQMFQLFQSYVAASGFMLQVTNLDVSYVLHICCKCVFQMFQLLSDICCNQMFFMLQVFYVVRPGAIRLGARRVGGRQMRPLGADEHWCCGRGALGACSS
jgi:hypothetical protein